jgi:transposase
MRSPNTIAFEKHILLELMGSTVEEISLRENIGYETVMGIIHRHMQTEIDWDSIEKLEQIGLDEISLKKGHKDFVTIVSAYIDGRVQLLAVLKDRKKDTVKSIPTHLKKQLNQFILTCMMILSIQLKRFLESVQGLLLTDFMWQNYTGKVLIPSVYKNLNV